MDTLVVAVEAAATAMPPPTVKGGISDLTLCLG